MQLLEWDNKLKLGVYEIDGQHQQLVCLINETYNALQLNNKYKLKTIMDEIIFYAKYHLSTEETLMNKYKYPSQDEHEIAHSTFFNDIFELQSKLNADEALHNVQIVTYLKDWLKNHILVTDRDLAGYLISKGVT